MQNKSMSENLDLIESRLKIFKESNYDKQYEKEFIYLENNISNLMYGVLKRLVKLPPNCLDRIINIGREIANIYKNHYTNSKISPVINLTEHNETIS